MRIPKTFLIAARNVFQVKNEIIVRFGETFPDGVFERDEKSEFREFAGELLDFAHKNGFRAKFDPQFEYRGRHVVKKNRFLDSIRCFPQQDLDNAYDDATAIIERSEVSNIKIIGFQDHDYPVKLQKIPERPAVLHTKGNFSVLEENVSATVIGTRKPTEKAVEIARRIAERLGTKGINVISGLALGCDSIAHEGALNAGGITTAILADGLDAESIYPKKNSKLALRIIDNGGLLLSEYAFGQKSSPHALVQRDNWQAQLSELVIPVQTSENGGTMHAVNWAYKHKIPIAAVYLSEYQNTEYADENRIGYENLITDFGAISIEKMTDLENILLKMNRCQDAR